MEKYLKMSDFVVGKVQLACSRNFDVCVSYDCVDPDMIVRKTMDAMEHAINSHDELVEINKELLAALEFVIEDKAPGYHDCTDDGEPECGWCVARKAIKKAKAAS